MLAFEGYIGSITYSEGRGLRVSYVIDILERNILLLSINRMFEPSPRPFLYVLPPLASIPTMEKDGK